VVARDERKIKRRAGRDLSRLNGVARCTLTQIVGWHEERESAPTDGLDSFRRRHHAGSQALALAA